MTHFCFIYLSSPSQRFAYDVPPKDNFCRVPRGGFILFHEVQVYVVAMNDFGQSTSDVLVLNPMKTG